MAAKSLHVPVQYVVSSEVTTFCRPYELKEAITNQISLTLDVEKLPQPNHWKLLLSCEVLGLTGEFPAMRSAVAYEAIAVVEADTDEDAIAVLRASAAPGVLGSVRTQLSYITQGTGMGTVTLPPLTALEVSALPPSSAGSSD